MTSGLDASFSFVNVGGWCNDRAVGAALSTACVGIVGLTYDNGAGDEHLERK